MGNWQQRKENAQRTEQGNGTGEQVNIELVAINLWNRRTGEHEKEGKVVYTLRQDRAQGEYNNTGNMGNRENRENEKGTEGTD